MLGFGFEADKKQKKLLCKINGKKNNLNATFSYMNASNNKTFFLLS